MNLNILKSSRVISGLASVMFVLALAGTALQAQGQLTTLYAFSGITDNPNNTAVAQGRDGNYYFTTCKSQNSNSELFKMTPTGTATGFYAPTPNCAHGLTQGTDGNFYIVTNDFSCCNNTDGAIYKVTPTGTATLLYSFTNGADGSEPYAAPIEGTNGTFYGTTTSYLASADTAYSITSSGTFKTLHTFLNTEAQNIYMPLLQGSDGNFYGISWNGGVNNLGSIFKMTATGTVTVLHSFAGTDGQNGFGGLLQAADGNFYGTTNGGGANGAGVLFKITSTGTYTVLYNFVSTGNSQSGGFPDSGPIQATNGLLYGVTGNNQGPWAGSWGVIYSFDLTTATYTTLYSFTGLADGGQPYGPLLQMTNGLLYGTTYVGGDNSGCSTGEWDGEIVIVSGCGTAWSYNINAQPFITLSSTSGKVGSQVGIFGQGFSSSSVVKFNGVQATKTTISGTTYITATVPTGATNGTVTVTTGSTTLTSTHTYTVHNSWASGAVMPTATAQSSAAVLGGSIYVIGGANTSGTVIANVQVYNPTTNTWSTGTPLPTVTQHSSAAVVNNILYVFGGDNGVTAPTNAVWAYSTKTKSWTSMAPMLTARNGTLAVVEKNIVYVIGGNLGNGANFVATVESYNPATNTWTAETPMAGAKDYAAGGLLGTTIVAADGAVASGQITGDTEGYNATTNAWSELAADPTARTGSCSGVISSALYDTGGYINNNGAATTVNESYSLSANKWTTTLLSIPQGTMYAAPAVDNGQLYCFGGWATLSGTAINNVQIYQP